MGNNTNTKYFVEHPRYGNQPIPSKYKYSKDDINSCHWRYSNLNYFADTAIPADISKQNYSIFPRSIYVDIEEQCEKCKRPFIFFAKEQKYWYEDLGFWIDAHCTRCIDCRKKDQELKLLQNTFQELNTKDNRTNEETKKLKQAALELFQLGFIRDKIKVDKIK